MKSSPHPSRVYDLAAMRGWRTLRLDRRPSAARAPQSGQAPIDQVSEQRKAA